MFRLALTAWILIVLASWVLGGPLGHDEAAYAIGGAALADGHASPWLYRSVGMHVLALPGVLAGGSELALRVPTVLFAIGFLFAVRRVGRLISEDVGAWAAAVVVGMHGLSLRGHELLSDLPSTTCVLMGLACLVEGLHAERPWRILLAAPWLASAFYLRYASVVPVALVGAAVVAVYARRVWARPAPILATFALLGLLLLPHALQAIAATGSPLGIVRYSSGVPHQTGFAGGLRDYLFGNPFFHYGTLAPPVLLAGLLNLRRGPTLVLWIVAVGQIVALGLLSHAQTRYIFVALTLLVVLGVDWIARRLPLRRVAFALVGIAWVGVLVAAIALGLRTDRWTRPIAEAGGLIRADAAGRPCHVVSRRFAQLMWYGGCASGNQGPHPEELDRASLVYGTWFENTGGTTIPEEFYLSTGQSLHAELLADRPHRFRILRMTHPR